MLENWLKPIDTNDLFDQLPFSDEQIGEHIVKHTTQFPSLQGVHVAIIGAASSSDLIRKNFYRMQNISDEIKIVDLGNLQNEKENTINIVVTELLSQNIIPIFLGIENSAIPAYVKSIHSKEHAGPSHPLFVDERIGYGKSFSRSYLNPLLESETPIVSEVSVIGYQMHYSDIKLTQSIKTPVHALRLGQLKSNLKSVEPYIRDTHCLFFMMSALKHAEAPAQDKSNPSGLLSEEACQICKYAGLNNDMQSLLIGHYNLEHDHYNQTVEVISQMIWYFIHGISNRFDEIEEEWVKYMINLEEEDANFTFYKSNISGRWWVSSDMQKHALKRACSYEDYLSSIKSHISDRLIDLFH